MRSGVRENLAGLAHDALTLAELQVQLLSVDLRDAQRGAGSALAQLAVGGILALGSIPVLLLGGAHVLIEILGWTPPAAFATVGTLAVFIAVVVMRAGWKASIRALAIMQRSRAEFSETLRWLKNSLPDGTRCDPSAPAPDGITARRC